MWIRVYRTSRRMDPQNKMYLRGGRVGLYSRMMLRPDRVNLNADQGCRTTMRTRYAERDAD